MTTGLYTHHSCLLHKTAPQHPENEERLKAIWAELKKPSYEPLPFIEAPKASLDAVLRVHSQKYIDELFALLPKEGTLALDEDTLFSPLSLEAALYAAGAVLAAVDAVMKGSIDNAFCAVRPPGHHAMQNRAMGFCLFNNIAIGAAHALHAYRFRKIAIVDFDVHHGNGTEDWALRQKDVLFFSSHQSPLWPGSGAAEVKGPLGNIINLPLEPQTDSAAFRHVITTSLLPRLNAYAPEFLFISAGFDGHKDDPLASLCLTEDDFAWVTKELKEVAKIHCQGRIVSVLEGGYNLDALAKSVGAHIDALKQP